MLYEFLFLMGRANYRQIKEELGSVDYKEIIKLEQEGKISFHRERLGELWIRCPAKNVWSIAEWVEHEPGITVGELRGKMKVSQRQFNAMLERAEVEKRKEGRLTALYPLTHASPPAGGTEDHQEISEALDDAQSGALAGVREKLKGNKELLEIIDGVVEGRIDEPIDWDFIGGGLMATKKVQGRLLRAKLIRKQGDEWWWNV